MTTVQSSQTSGRRARRDCKTSAFSLIEVTLSIGIIAFALVALIALLPIGLMANRNAAEQARAMQTLNALAICVQKASVTGTIGTAPSITGYTYTALQPFNAVKWDVKVKPTTVTANIFVGENGLPVATSGSARQLAYVSITPPADKLSVGQAYIGVTWDRYVMNQPSNNWQGANGQKQLSREKNYVESHIYFNP